jgi:hypothetical protein
MEVINITLDHLSAIVEHSYLSNKKVVGSRVRRLFWRMLRVVCKDCFVELKAIKKGTRAAAEPEQPTDELTPTEELPTVVSSSDVGTDIEVSDGQQQ